MKKLVSILVIGAIIGLSAGSPLFSANPNVTKTVVASDDASAVIMVNVTASGQSIYGITITDNSASIEDIVSPKGWSGLASDGRIVFSTVDKPITSGTSKSFRIVTTNAKAGFSVSLRDANRLLVVKKDI